MNEEMTFRILIYGLAISCVVVGLAIGWVIRKVNDENRKDGDR